MTKELISYIRSTEFRQKFWSNVDINNGYITDEDCWLWTNTITPHGYGLTNIGHERFSAHRASYIMYKGIIYKGDIVCHDCDCRSCVNPNHLFTGTQSDNMQDCKEKGLLISFHKKGSNNIMARLTEDQVKEIRRLAKLGIYQRILAEQFKVTQPYISEIILRKVWTHIPA